jgi:hypothetical protein
MERMIAGGARDIGALIGALEIGTIVSHADAAIEASVAAKAGPTAFNSGMPGCPHFIDDGALEMTVKPLTIARTPATYCYNIDDGALEATVHAGPSTHLRRNTVCLNIDDGAVEAAATFSAGPTRAGLPGCSPFVDDGALEMTVKPMTIARTPATYCYNIDDGALEGTAYAGPNAKVSMLRRGTRCEWVRDDALEAAATFSAGPTRGGMPGCLPFVDDGALEMTVKPMTIARTPATYCYNIDDGALEASTATMGPAPTMGVTCLTRVGCGHIDDDALEGAAYAGPSNNPPRTALKLPNGACLPTIDDGALEAMTMSPDPMAMSKVVCGPVTKVMGCRIPPHIDDSALESTVFSGANSTYRRLPNTACIG